MKIDKQNVIIGLLLANFAFISFVWENIEWEIEKTRVGLNYQILAQENYIKMLEAKNIGDKSGEESNQMFYNMHKESAKIYLLPQ